MQNNKKKICNTCTDSIHETIWLQLFCWIFFDADVVCKKSLQSTNKQARKKRDVKQDEEAEKD